MINIAAREFNKKVGYRLYLRRKILKLPQKKVAYMLNVSPQCIQKYEKGDIGLSLYNLYKIASLFMVDIDYFFQDITDNKEKTTVLKDCEADIRLQILLKNFVNIKNKKIARNIENLIYELSSEN